MTTAPEARPAELGSLAADLAQEQSVPDQPLDHLGRLALRVLKVPYAMVAVGQGDRWFLSTAAGQAQPVLGPFEEQAGEQLRRQLGECGSMTVIRDVAVDPRTRDNLWLRALGVRALAAFPFEGPDGRVLGAFCIADTKRRSWGNEELELLGAVAETAASKVTLRSAVRLADRTSELLQHSLLTDLPDVGHVQLAARYLPAQETAQVGGDWYDAFVLPDGLTALVVGDVAGHDLSAATKMGQLRNLLRGIAYHANPPPHEVLSGLDRVAYSLGVAELATAIYGRLEARGDGSWRLRWANAGHPPPLLCTADGQARYLDTPSGVLLAFGDAEHTDGVVDLPPLSTLLLYTDGLVESRDLDIDRGFDRLRRTAMAAAHLQVDQFCDHVVGRLADGANEDDVTVLAVRTPQVGARDQLSWTPDVPVAGGPLPGDR
ncbi:MAG: hypothetical protein QOE76_3565 [Frankiales bacterium]|nr:hypothetical protein [Frankiales bacterium]